MSLNKEDYEKKFENWVGDEESIKEEQSKLKWWKKNEKR